MNMNILNDIVQIVSVPKAIAITGAFSRACEFHMPLVCLIHDQYSV